MKFTKGKLKIYDPVKYSKSRNKDKGFGCYTVYYGRVSFDVYGVYSPKAAVRTIIKCLKNGLL